MDIFKTYGLKATAPRSAVLTALESAKVPLNAKELHSKLSEKGIDLVTVYRTIASFEEKRIIRRVDLRKESVSYELALDHHHHIVCTSCGTLEDIDACEIEELSKKLVKKSKQFTKISEHTFELFGLCTACV